MKRWVCQVFLEADESELMDLVSELKQRFGDRCRTKTDERWKYDQERAPAEPFRVRPSQFTFAEAEHSARRGKGRL